MLKMLKAMPLALVFLTGLAAPRPALAGCTTDLADCYARAAKVDSFWYRWAAGIDCELEYTDCVRQKIFGR
jgi:hypothetical protein